MHSEPAERASVAPLTDKVAALADHIERLDYAIGHLADRLTTVLRPDPGEALAANEQLTEVRRMSATVQSLGELDEKVVAAVDRINGLKDRLDT